MVVGAGGREIQGNIWFSLNTACIITFRTILHAQKQAHQGRQRKKITYIIKHHQNKYIYVTHNSYTEIVRRHTKGGVNHHIC